MPFLDIYILDIPGLFDSFYLPWSAASLGQPMPISNYTIVHRSCLLLFLLLLCLIIGNRPYARWPTILRSAALCDVIFCGTRRAQATAGPCCLQFVTLALSRSFYDYETTWLCRVVPLPFVWFASCFKIFDDRAGEPAKIENRTKQNEVFGS